MEEEHDYMDEDLEGGVEKVDHFIDDDNEQRCYSCWVGYGALLYRV